MTYFNGWVGPEADESHSIATVADLQRIAADMAYAVALAAGGFDAGFEAGVLATENGLGRYDG